MSLASRAPSSSPRASYPYRELTASKYDVTIVARNMPGDPLAPGWASPFAGANLAPVHQFQEGVTEHHVRMQKACFETFFKLADAYPESSARRVGIFEYQEKLRSCKDVWFNILPNVRTLGDVREGRGGR